MIGIIISMGILVVFGIIFSNGKGSSLIAGFNTLEKEKQEKYNVEALCKFMGKMMFALSFSLVFLLVYEAYQVKWMFACGLIVFIGILIWGLFYVNTGNRFKK
ncbi:DUF3784 domain-containing protein [Bacillus sp. AK128]